MYALVDQVITNALAVLFSVVVVIMLLALVLLRVVRSLAVGPDGVTQTGKYGGTK